MFVLQTYIILKLKPSKLFILKKAYSNPSFQERVSFFTNVVCLWISRYCKDQYIFLIYPPVKIRFLLCPPERWCWPVRCLVETEVWLVCGGDCDCETEVRVGPPHPLISRLHLTCRGNIPAWGATCLYGQLAIDILRFIIMSYFKMR